jgi:hypothetical protein
MHLPSAGGKTIGNTHATLQAAPPPARASATGSRGVGCVVFCTAVATLKPAGPMGGRR